MLPRAIMERLAWKIRATPYKVRLHSRGELRKIFDGYGEVMLPYYDEGELGPRNEGLRKAWEALSGVGLVRQVAGAIVPQYFIAGGRRPAPNR